MEKEAYNKRKRELYHINKERELARKKKYRENLTEDKKKEFKEYNDDYRIINYHELKKKREEKKASLLTTP